MRSTRTRPSVSLLVVALTAVLVTGGLAGPVLAASPATNATPDSTAVQTSDSAPDAALESTAARSTVAQDGRPADPTTEDTIGYVEGYWYDDELPVDEQSDAVVEEDALDPVVYRAMARVERIRNMTFEEEVDVEVVSRAEYRETNDGRFVNVSSANRLEQNVAYEALFMVDRETEAVDATQTVYGGAVAGYYDPETDEIVIVSESPETPELDELTLGHELVHALQDQRFDLSALGGRTQDRELAKNGLVEGDASRVEREYETRCGYEWHCLSPTEGDTDRSLDINWGIYFTVYQPYSDGPHYVNYLRQQGEGWSAVNAAYDDPPTTTSAVIHPGSERDPVNISVPDRSSEDWRQLRVDGVVANDTVGEAGMVAMFAAGALDGGSSVIGTDELLDDEGYNYNHSYTNGWSGDRLVVYTNDEAEAASDPAEAAGHAGYVWRTQWQSGTDTQQFVNGYLRHLEGHGAEPVEGRQDTYVIDDGGYAGAYYLDRTNRILTIVRAPSVAELPNVEAGAAPDGEDTLEIVEGSDSVPGFGLTAAVGAIAVVVLGAGTRLAWGRIGSDRD
ncbi:Hvo_1808 family surface protein [Natrinema longum]|uniref:Hvo_1808 family surface protein n=1 Tax=Natrinema longum TaxID=370324 RepID=A0A8A2U4V4_9EURY|nr:Hvo_1808 family surface protein [Natrinema longum]MBZ6494781.1 Hvo_1808 family surface protein [Natrinema longum]QSW83911.1 Hvo_1808 family surface protein [Natrinema longum]